jgi:diaminopimelate decarboxylase
MDAPPLLPETEDPTIAEMLAARPHLHMHGVEGLMVEGVPLATIAAACGTPCWVMSAGALRSRLARLRAAFEPLGAHIHYAVKANDHLAVLKILAAGGAGADVVSGGELRRALQAGIAPGHIVFSGVGKTVAELRLAAETGIAQVNVESAEELAMLSAIAASAGHTVPVALRINPDIDAGTHAKITTGRADNKFGVGLDTAAALFAQAAELPGIRAVGLALHIGSQISAMAPYRAAFARVAGLVQALRAGGHTVTRLDCGGGLGIRYRDEVEGSPAALAGAMQLAFEGLALELMVEPGRWLAGPSGLLLTSVILTKTTGSRHFTVLDAAMNDLVRPAMYDSWHGMVPVSAADALGAPALSDIVGPVCETGDTFARQRMLPALAHNAVVAILDTGAYGSVMSSTYNARPLAAQVMVDGDRWAIIRPRQTVEALWSGESIPDWLTPGPVTT